MIATACNGSYVRGEDGTWRYAGSPDAVPGAEDMTPSSLYNLPVRRIDGKRYVVVPRSLAANEPELAWCLDHDAGPAPDPGRARGMGRDPQVPDDAMLVPLDEWTARDEPIGMWAPELYPERLMDTAAVAARLGVSAATVRSYLARGDMVRPQGHLMGSPWWTRPIVERWIASRPGQGVGGGRPRKGAL